MLTVHTTPGCRRTAVVLLVLHEAGKKYELDFKTPSYFVANHYTLGPSVSDGDFLLLELDAIIRYIAAAYGRPELYGRTARARALVDQFIELHARWWQGPINRITRSDIDAESREREIMTMQRTLHCLEQRLAHSQYIAADDFTLADCPALMLMAAPAFGIDLARWPKVVDYTKRLVQRPAWREALTRSRELALA